MWVEITFGNGEDGPGIDWNFILGSESEWVVSYFVTVAVQLVNGIDVLST